MLKVNFVNTTIKLCLRVRCTGENTSILNIPTFFFNPSKNFFQIGSSKYFVTSFCLLLFYKNSCSMFEVTFFDKMSL